LTGCTRTWSGAYSPTRSVALFYLLLLLISVQVFVVLTQVGDIGALIEGRIEGDTASPVHTVKTILGEANSISELIARQLLERMDKTGPRRTLLLSLGLHDRDAIGLVRPLVAFVEDHRTW
jgi:hypothetical protein